MTVDLFTDTYAEARAAFLRACTQAGAAVDSHEQASRRGPGGERLFLDIARFGPGDARGVLVMLSGTHGAEGFAGSAVQAAWVRDGFAQALPDDIAVVLVHAVNPFGFAHCLRSTAGNVDMNRNWIDHDGPLPDNPLYRDLHHLLCPPQVDEAHLALAAQQVAGLADAHGQWTIDDALSRGQYEFPNGYYYGGDAPAWPRRVLEAALSPMFARARRVAVVDWHSGPVGDGELIHLCYAERNSLAHERAARWWGPENLDDREVDRLWGGRRPGRHGTLIDGLARLKGRDTQFAGGVIEFCSARPPSGPAGAFRIAMLERWLRFEGGLDGPQANDVREEIRDNYAPRRALWEQRVIDNGLEVCEATLAGLAEWLAEDEAAREPGRANGRGGDSACA